MTYICAETGRASELRKRSAAGCRACTLLLCYLSAILSTTSIAHSIELQRSSHGDPTVGIIHSLEQLATNPNEHDGRAQFEAWSKEVHAAIGHWRNQQHESAISAALRALSHATSLNDRTVTIASNLLLGVVHTCSSEFDKAPLYFQKAILVAGDDVASLGLTREALLQLLGKANLEIGEFAGAIKAFEDAVTSLRTSSSPAPFSESHILCGLADASLALGQRHAADRYCQLAERLLADTHADCRECRALLLISKSKIAAEDWDYLRASVLLEQAIGIMPAGSSVQLADTKCRLAIAKLRQKDFVRSDDLARESLGLAVSLVGERHPLHVRCLACAAESKICQGLVHESRKDLLTAAELCDISQASRHPIKGDVLIHLSTVCQIADDLDQADATLEHACATFRRAGMQMQLAQALSARAVLAHNRHDYSGVRQYTSESQAILDSLSIVKHPVRAKNVFGGGGVAKEAGDYRSALKAYNYALSEFSVMYGDDDQRTVLAMINVGVCHAHLGNYEECVTILKSATKQIQLHNWEDRPEYQAAERTLVEATEKITRL